LSSCQYDCLIQCEVCDKLFPKRYNYANVIDADGYDDIAYGVEEGFCNRITCPHCGIEFTLENPLMVFSWQYKTYATAGFIEIDGLDFYKTANLQFALNLSGAKDVNLRKTDYAIEACEKIHIAKHGLDDVKTELFKLAIFPEYADMKSDEETIIFDRIQDGNLIFSHRHFTDSIITKFYVPFSQYESFECNIPSAPKAKWIKIDKEYILNYPEGKNES